MKYNNVCLETIAYRLPEEVITSDELEARLAPLYERLRLPEGRLELISGIRDRRVWPADMLPGTGSVAVGELALGQVGFDRRHIGALIHGSVCRDCLEPATACSVHHRLGLGTYCTIYDVSNACLGLLNGIIQVADLIEMGRIRAGLVVGTEHSRSLMEQTIERLNTDESLTRSSIKTEFASLTIGSGSAAVVLCDRELSQTGNRLLGGSVRAFTDACRLCQSEGMETLMQTDSEALLRAGLEAAQENFADFLKELDWTTDTIDRTFCHQVGRVHQLETLRRLGLEVEKDFATYPTLGNTGSVALPMSAAIGIEQGVVKPGDNVALLGIGSGINVIMLGVQWGGAE